jgi:AcrR family transcriptional regulator
MGRKSSIDEAMGAAILEAYQRLGSKKAVARELGLSDGAVRRFFDSLESESSEITTQSPGFLTRRAAISLAADLWDTRRALEENYLRAVKLVEQLERGILEERNGPNGPYTTLTPIAVHIAALKEVREHIKLASALSGQLLSLEAIQAFQAAVLEAIEVADRDTRDRIISALQNAGALVGAALGPGDR